MRWIAVSMLLLAVAGCQSRQLYPGPARPVSEIAILERESGRGVIQFVSVDGAAVKGSGFHVLPGEHVIEVTNRAQLTVFGARTQPACRLPGCSQMSVESVSRRVWVKVPCRAVFVTRAGRTYFVRGDVVELGRGAKQRSFVPDLWVADRAAPGLDIADHRFEY